MNDIFYKELTAPLSCRGFVLEDPDGDFTVFVNRDLSPEFHCIDPDMDQKLHTTFRT